MESKGKVLCILVVYFLQLCLPVESATCDTTCLAADGTCDGDLCVCVDAKGGTNCGQSCDAACNNLCTGPSPNDCGVCDPACEAAGGSCKSVYDYGPTPAVSSVECVCNTGFTGDTCEKCSNDANGCNAHGTCDVTAGTCTCTEGYSGLHCEEETEQPTCDDTACTGASGVCNGDVCVCAAGTGGVVCADTCDATCNDLCTAVGPGDSCGTCDPACVTAGGSCKSVYDYGPTPAVPAVKCVCNTGFTGDTCEKCSDDANGCNAQGTCDAAGGTCTCDATHVGTYCQHECTCTSLETCAAKADDSGIDCTCITGLSGDTCETIACATSDPCMNGGTCNTDMCDCPANYAGTICQHACSPVCTTGNCTVTADGSGAECPDDSDSGASSLLFTWAILILSVWSAIKLY